MEKECSIIFIFIILIHFYFSVKARIQEKRLLIEKDRPIDIYVFNNFLAWRNVCIDFSQRYFGKENSIKAFSILGNVECTFPPDFLTIKNYR